MATDTTSGRQIERAAALRSLLADRLASDFAAFVKKAWPIIHATRPLVWSWHSLSWTDRKTYEKPKENDG